jgi:hypothetical protein
MATDGPNRHVSFSEGGGSQPLLQQGQKEEEKKTSNPKAPTSARGPFDRWKIPERYEVRQMIGTGSYGSVGEAYDHEHKRLVAIKRIGHMFEDLIDCKRILREIAILSKLNHDHIVQIFDIVAPPSFSTFDELYIVMEICDCDLKKIVPHGRYAVAAAHKYAPVQFTGWPQVLACCWYLPPRLEACELFGQPGLFGEDLRFWSFESDWRARARTLAGSSKYTARRRSYSNGRSDTGRCANATAQASFDGTRCYQVVPSARVDPVAGELHRGY